MNTLKACIFCGEALLDGVCHTCEAEAAQTWDTHDDDYYDAADVEYNSIPDDEELPW